MAENTRRLSPADQDRIAAAVASAEAHTSGEIMCVLAQEVSDYREVPLAWAAGAALLLPPIAFLIGIQPMSVPEVLGGWSVAQSPAAEARIGLAITAYAAAQAILFVVAALVVSIPSVRRRLTPGGLKDRRVHQAAFSYFLGAGVHLTPDRTGVLIFTSVEDHRMEIIADETIHARVGQKAWDDVIAEALKALKAGGPAEGLVRAVELCGAILAEHFPDDKGPNAYPNRPLQV